MRSCVLLRRLVPSSSQPNAAHLRRQWTRPMPRPPADPRALSWPLANAAARGLGHRPGPRWGFGVMSTATCTKCGDYAVERVDDGLGVTGQAVSEPCGKSKID